MKKTFTLIVMITTVLTVFAQAPQKMSYQAVIRNTTGGLITNHAVGMKISILQGSASGTIVYQEIYNPNPETNANGLVSIEIGTGLPITGTFPAINWAAGPYYLKTETDPAGGTSYTIVGTNQLISVPYALYSKMSESIANNSVTSARIVDGNVATVDLADGSVTSAKIADATVAAADLSANAVTTDKINAGAVTGAKIAQGGAINGQVLKWNSTSWVPANDEVGVAGGTTGNVQFNNAGILGGDANFVWDNTNKRLGIGISTPAYQLQVTGNNLQTVHSETSYGGGAAIFGVGNSASGSNVGVRGISYSTSGTGIWGDATATTGTTYAVRGAVTSVNGFSGYFTGGKFYVQGNVGIGVTTPDSKLDVEGTVNIGGGNASELNRDQTTTANLVPICYGCVSAAGTIHTAGSTTNFTTIKTGTGVYEINISGVGVDYYNFTVSATLIGPGPAFIVTGSANGHVTVNTFNTAGAANDRAFYFVVYKP